MSVQGPHTQSIMTTKEMALSFLPIILFSIVLPLIDIFTDLRMIIRLFSGITVCIYYDYDINVSESEWYNCRSSDDLSTFCLQYPNVCRTEEHNKFAILLLGKYKKVFLVFSLVVGF